ncbi:hypothetical protein [Lysobacter sp. A289]
MDSIGMLRVAVALFAIAAAGGLVMAAIRLFGKRNPPSWLAMVHGLLAAAGLTLLAYAAIAGQVPNLAWVALGLLVLAAAGGALMNLVYQWQRRILPLGLLLGHVILAVVGFVALIAAAFG